MPAIKSFLLLLLLSCVSTVDLAGTGYSVAQEVAVVVAELKEFPPADAGASPEQSDGIPSQPRVREPAQWLYSFIETSQYFSFYSPRAPPRSTFTA